MQTAQLPSLMVAPNGARRTRADHPALPVTVAQTVDTAVSCYRAGANGIHAHVRNAEGKHVLDVGLYRELIDELAIQVPKLAVQITTEAIGIYQPEQQRQLVYQLQPDRVSISITEMLSDNNISAARDFYYSCHNQGIGVQHILYADSELDHLAQLIDDRIIPADDLQLLFVLGRYSKNQQSHPRDLQPFLNRYQRLDLVADWGLCAFGSAETACLVAAAKAGGKMRIGFENSLLHSDGSIAIDNAERVKALLSELKEVAELVE